MNLLTTTELYILKGWITCFINYISIFKLKTKQKHQDWCQSSQIVFVHCHSAFWFFWWTQSILIFYLIAQRFDHQRSLPPKPLWYPRPKESKYKRKAELNCYHLLESNIFQLFNSQELATSKNRISNSPMNTLVVFRYKQNVGITYWNYVLSGQDMLILHKIVQWRATGKIKAGNSEFKLILVKELFLLEGEKKLLWLTNFC